jgi:hypothetical protein
VLADRQATQERRNLPTLPFACWVLPALPEQSLELIEGFL